MVVAVAVDAAFSAIRERHAVDLIAVAPTSQHAGGDPPQVSNEVLQSRSVGSTAAPSPSGLECDRVLPRATRLRAATYVGDGISSGASLVHDQEDALAAAAAAAAAAGSGQAQADARTVCDMASVRHSAAASRHRTAAQSVARRSRSPTRDADVHIHELDDARLQRLSVMQRRKQR